MLAKTLALFAIAASLAVAAPTPDWNGNGGHKHHGHGGHRHGGWRSSSEVATPTDNGDSSDASPTPAASNDNSDSSSSDSSNSGSNAGNDSAANQDSGSGSPAPGQNLAAQPQSNSGAQPSGQTFTGDATFYDITNPAENEGNSAGSVACSSQKYSNSDAIIAINSAQFPGSCGKTVIIKDTTTGNTATATAVDECTSCGKNGIDLTPSLWQQLHNGHSEDGIFTATWSFQ